ncbi:Glycyl-tRNA synthetase, class IIc, beta subunit, partial [Candidatus Magnetobacterium bavaricum]
MANDITLILEIGVEEMPATFLPETIKQLGDITEGVLSDNGVEFSQVRAYATPRRLAVIATGVSEYQKSRVLEHFGPPQKAAFSADGLPTKAAIGFAQLHGIAVEDLIIKQKTVTQTTIAKQLTTALSRISDHLKPSQEPGASWSKKEGVKGAGPLAG